MPSTEETNPSPGCGGNESLSQVAEDLGLDETELHQAFRSWLANQDAVSPEMRAASYTVYRVDKLSWAFKVTSKSRCTWRARAMELGSPGHLYAVDQDGSGKKFSLTEIKGKNPQKSPSEDLGDYDTLSQVAEDLGLDETELHQAFRSWLANQDAVSPEMRAASYALYRVDKLSWSFKATSKSRCSWRARAMELGSPGHLYAVDQDGKKFSLTEVKGKSPQNPEEGNK